MALARDVSKVVVLGMGKVTGRAVVDALLESDVVVHVSESTETQDTRSLADQFASRGVTVSFGAPDLSLLEWADLIIPSPGVAPSNPLLAQAARAGVPVWSEIELGWRFRQGPVLAVTGTNGKTTVATLLGSLLETGGFPAVVAGNIGIPLVEAARSAQPGWPLVCETSSFQLHFIESFHPSIAIVMNVAEDHYDWHGDFESYLQAKARITEFQGPDDLLIVKADDAGCVRIAASSRASLWGFGLDEPSKVKARLEHGTGREVLGAAGVVADVLVVESKVRTTEVISRSDIRLKGAHNTENVLASTLGAIGYGVDIQAIRHAVAAFEGLPHRSVEVAVVNGVKYVDDSKATNPHATLHALEDLRDVVLIAGGQSRGLDLSELKQVQGKLKALIAMGETAPEFVALFDQVKSLRASSIEDAVDIAYSLAEPGDTVLLSPGCSSLDQYSSYAERGDRFCKAVLSL